MSSIILLNSYKQILIKITTGLMLVLFVGMGSAIAGPDPTLGGAPATVVATHPTPDRASATVARTSLGTVSKVAVVGPVSNAAVVGILDNFNRPNGTLGPNWTSQAAGASMAIVGNTAKGGLKALSTYNGVASSVVEADVAYNVASGGIQYAGLVMDYLDINNNLFLKVQGTAGSFTNGYCYVGNNSSGGSFGGLLYTLTTPFTTAHMKIEKIGADVIITYSNIDGGATSQTYTCAAAPTTGGTGIGIAAFNSLASIDNFAATTPTPQFSLQFNQFSDCLNLWFDPVDGTVHGNIPVYAPGTVFSGLYDGANTMAVGFYNTSQHALFKFSVNPPSVDVYTVDPIGSSKTLVTSDTWSVAPSCPGTM